MRATVSLLIFTGSGIIALSRHLPQWYEKQKVRFPYEFCIFRVQSFFYMFSWLLTERMCVFSPVEVFVFSSDLWHLCGFRSLIFCCVFLVYHLFFNMLSMYFDIQVHYICKNSLNFYQFFVDHTSCIRIGSHPSLSPPNLPSTTATSPPKQSKT